MEKPKGCTTAQRRWVLERDQYRCQFLTTDGKLCGRTYNLQVHHIVPRGYAAMHLTTKDVNVPENLITLCEKHHIAKNVPARERCQTVHPDTELARLLYMTGDKDAFRKMAERRRELNIKGIKYWNDAFDEYFKRRAATRNKVMVKPFPYRSNDGDRLEVNDVHEQG